MGVRSCKTHLQLAVFNTKIVKKLIMLKLSIRGAQVNL